MLLSPERGAEARKGEAKPLWNSSKLALPKDNVTSAKGIFVATALHEVFFSHNNVN